MPMKQRNDFICKLTDTNEKELLTFKASASSILVNNADFSGGGIASGGQAFSVFTEREYPYAAYTHRVYIDGIKYTIVSVAITFIKPLGVTGGKRKKIYILELN